MTHKAKNGVNMSHIRNTQGIPEVRGKSELTGVMKMAKNINALLSEIHAAAARIVEAGKSTGDIDYSESESLFGSMKEIAELKDSARNVDPDYSGVFSLCLLTADIESINDIDCSSGLPNDWRDLPAAVVDSCPAINQVEDIRNGVALLSKGSLSMDSDDRAKFMSALGDLLASYDLMGSDAVDEIFSA